jgi:hypothetical protein
MNEILINQQLQRSTDMTRKPHLDQPLLRFLEDGTGTSLLSQGLLILLFNLAPDAAAAFFSHLAHASRAYLNSTKAKLDRSGSPWLYRNVFGLRWLVQWLVLGFELRSGGPRLHAVAALLQIMAISSYAKQHKMVFR